MTFIVIGIDGGGSKTHAMVADEQGRTIAETVGPGSAVRPGQAEHSANVIADVVRDALASCEMTHVTPRALCVGVAGAGRETERQELWQALVGRDLATELVIHSDYSIALDDAFGDGPGVLMISGTGSVAFGRGPDRRDGALWRLGARCAGDEGSGAWIGRRALSVVTAAADGREPETALTGADPHRGAGERDDRPHRLGGRRHARDARDARASRAERRRVRAICARTHWSRSPSRSWCCTSGRSRANCSATSAPRCRSRSQAECCRAAARSGNDSSTASSRRCPVRRSERSPSSPPAAPCEPRSGLSEKR